MSESSDTFKVTCQQCGMELDYRISKLDFNLRFTCTNCGHELTKDQPSATQIVEAATNLATEQLIPKLPYDPRDTEN